MAMYAPAVTPLIRAVSTQGAKQVWSADDATAGDTGGIMWLTRAQHLAIMQTAHIHG